MKFFSHDFELVHPEYSAVHNVAPEYLAAYNDTRFQQPEQ